jgi:hypothetical protein
MSSSDVKVIVISSPTFAKVFVALSEIIEPKVTVGTPKSSEERELLLKAEKTAKKLNRAKNVVFLIIVCNLYC